MKRLLFLSCLIVSASIWSASHDRVDAVEKMHDTYVNLIMRVLQDAPLFQARGADWEIRATLDGILEDMQAFRQENEAWFDQHQTLKKSWLASETQLDSIRQAYRTLDMAIDEQESSSDDY